MRKDEPAGKRETGGEDLPSVPTVSMVASTSFSNGAATVSISVKPAPQEDVQVTMDLDESHTDIDADRLIFKKEFTIQAGHSMDNTTVTVDRKDLEDGDYQVTLKITSVTGGAVLGKNSTATIALSLGVEAAPQMKVNTDWEVEYGGKRDFVDFDGETETLDIVYVHGVEAGQFVYACYGTLQDFEEISEEYTGDDALRFFVEYLRDLYYELIIKEGGLESATTQGYAYFPDPCCVEWYEQDFGEYQFWVFGFKEDGTPTYEYSCTNIYIEENQPLDTYTRWLGDWEIYEDGKGNEVSYKVTFSHKVNNRKLLMEGYQGDEGHPITLRFHRSGRLLLASEEFEAGDALFCGVLDYDGGTRVEGYLAELVPSDDGLEAVSVAQNFTSQQNGHVISYPVWYFTYVYYDGTDVGEPACGAPSLEFKMRKL